MNMFESILFEENLKLCGFKGPYKHYHNTHTHTHTHTHTQSYAPVYPSAQVLFAPYPQASLKHSKKTVFVPSVPAKKPISGWTLASVFPIFSQFAPSGQGKHQN